MVIFDGFAACEGFGFGGERYGFSAFDDSVEFKDVIPVSMGEKNFGEGKFMALERGEERIGISPSVESGREKSFWIPYEVVIHGHFGERSGELKDVGWQGGSGCDPVTVS